MTSHLRPRSISGNLSIQVVGNETLIYDERRHLAFCLNRVSAAIWRMCDGSHTVAMIATAATVELQSPVSEELVHFALAELRRDHLLDADTVEMPAPAVSRRAMMGKLGLTAAMMLPVVAMVVAPKAAQAYSGSVTSGQSAPASGSVTGGESTGQGSSSNSSSSSSSSSSWTWKP
jgi:hypothetical protein